MKYTLTINQRLIIEDRHDIDIIDSAILETMKGMQGAEGILKIIEENIAFYWMSHQKLCDELPILRIKKDSMYRRIKKLIEKGYILPYPKNKELRMTYYRVTMLTESLFSGIGFKSDISEINPKGIGKKSDVVSDLNPKDNNTIDNKTINKKTSDSSLFDESTFSSPVLLKKFIQDKNSPVLALPDQPSKKIFDRWLNSYPEDHIKNQLLKFEEFLKNKKNCAKKIKSASRTLNNWLKNDWIQDEDQRQIFNTWRQWWNDQVKLPFAFNFFHTSEDRKALEACLAFLMASQGEQYLGYFRQILANIPDFWKGKRLSSIAKNLPSIVKEIQRTGSQRPRSDSKSSATVKNTDWI